MVTRRAARHEIDDDFTIVTRKKLLPAQLPNYIAWTVVQLPDGRWKYSWTYPVGPYRIVLYGKLLATTLQQSYTYEEIARDVPPPLEIVTGLAASEINPPFLTLQWYGNPLVDQYTVQELITTWQTVMTVTEIGLPLYTITTPRVNDGESHQYRVLPGTTIFTFNAVTPPIMPDVTVLLSGGNITIA